MLPTCKIHPPVNMSPAQQAVFDALLGLQRNGQPDATAVELRDVIERLGLYVVNGQAVRRIEKGWVNGRLSELAAMQLVVKTHGQARFNELTRRWSGSWRVSQLLAGRSAGEIPISARGPADTDARSPA